MLRHDVDLGEEDYNLVATGNKKLASQRDELKLHCESLKADRHKFVLTPKNELLILKRGLSLPKPATLMLLPRARKI
jgi:hypothetical protein